MKSEAEIRRYVRALRVVRNAKCDCAMRGGRHALKCEMGGRMTDAAIEVLLWVLNQSPGHDELAATLISQTEAAR